MIDVTVTEKRFGATAVLRDITLKVAPGDCVALLGPSGIGKSTLMRIAAGLDQDFTGTVTVADTRAMVFQEPTLLPWRSVAQNIALFHPGLDTCGLNAALARVGLADHAQLFPTQLSLGQQRRLALARAFAGRPKALFLDEPFVSLDPALADDMAQLTADLIAETRPAVLFITHTDAEAERLATRTLRLAGSPATLHPAS